MSLKFKATDKGTEISIGGKTVELSIPETATLAAALLKKLMNSDGEEMKTLLINKKDGELMYLILNAEEGTKYNNTHSEPDSGIKEDEEARRVQETFHSETYYKKELKKIWNKFKKDGIDTTGMSEKDSVMKFSESGTYDKAAEYGASLYMTDKYKCGGEYPGGFMKDLQTAWNDLVTEYNFPNDMSDGILTITFMHIYRKYFMTKAQS